MGVSFLDELGSYYLEVDLKQKDLKHALAGTNKFAKLIFNFKRKKY